RSTRPASRAPLASPGSRLLILRRSSFPADPPTPSVNGSDQFVKSRFSPSKRSIHTASMFSLVRLETISPDPVKRAAGTLLGVVLVAVGRGEPPRALSRTQAPRIDAVVVSVADLDRSVRFYTDVLTFSKESQHEGTFESLERLTGVFGSSVKVASLRLGGER